MNKVQTETTTHYIGCHDAMKNLKSKLKLDKDVYCMMFCESGLTEVGIIRSISIEDKKASVVDIIRCNDETILKIQSVMIDSHKLHKNIAGSKHDLIEWGVANNKVTRKKHDLIKISIATTDANYVITFPFYFFPPDLKFG
jgi:hypothetical protein